MLIIGSVALNHHFDDFHRVSKDLDIAIKDMNDVPQLKENQIVKDYKGKIEYLENPIIFKYQNEGYLTPDLMLSLKISHLFWKTNFHKHLFDIQWLLKKGCKYDINIIKELMKFWDEYLPKVRRSKLEQSKDKFFTNAVNKSVDQHDYLHTLINPIPMYTLLLKDGAEVELDENKWNNLSYQEKIDVCWEETAVMAYERYPNFNYREAFTRQLDDNIQKHFPFYIALFAIENYPKLLKPKFNYINHIKNQL